MTMKIKVYNDCKYDETSKKVWEHVYNDVAGFEVKTICDEEIYNDGYDEVDEHKEYLIITFADGTTSTFRNSHVDIFKV